MDERHIDHAQNPIEGEQNPVEEEQKKPVGNWVAFWTPDTGECVIVGDKWAPYPQNPFPTITDAYDYASPYRCTYFQGFFKIVSNDSQAFLPKHIQILLDDLDSK